MVLRVKIPIFSGNDVSAGDEGFAGTEVGSDLKNKSLAQLGRV